MIVLLAKYAIWALFVRYRRYLLTYPLCGNCEIAGRGWVKAVVFIKKDGFLHTISDESRRERTCLVTPILMLGIMNGQE